MYRLLVHLGRPIAMNQEPAAAHNYLPRLTSSLVQILLSLLLLHVKLGICAYVGHYEWLSAVLNLAILTQRSRNQEVKVTMIDFQGTVA